MRKFITANFITAVFQNFPDHYVAKNLANAILWAIYFVTAYIKKKFADAIFA